MSTTHTIMFLISIAMPVWALWSAKRVGASEDADLYMQIGRFIREELK